LEWFILGVGEMVKSNDDNVSTLQNNSSQTKKKEPLTNESGKSLTKHGSHKKNYPSNEIKEENLLLELPEKYKLATNKIRAHQYIPLYDIKTTTGLVPLFSDDTKPDPVDFLTIPNLPSCDGAIHVAGDSMHPLLKSGDIVLYKQINDISNNIFWGEMYLVSIDMEGEEYVTVKYIQKSEKEDCIKLVSYSENHSDKEVPLSKVRALAFVKATIRINSIR